jgi:hypothetical protein
LQQQVVKSTCIGCCGGGGVVLQAGLARFPHSAHMVLVYVNFLGSVANSVIN